jgi:hypothetical protein
MTESNEIRKKTKKSPKQANKQVRQPAEESPKVEAKTVRKKIGRNLKLDVSYYERKYPDKQLLLPTDYGTDVEFWIQQGAVPVPRENEGAKIYKGINDHDKSDGGYVKFVGGKDKNGNVYYHVLLMIDPEIYDEVKLAPQRERQQEIERAMKTGENQSDISKHLPGGGGVSTYAPNLPDGQNQGFNRIT